VFISIVYVENSEKCHVEMTAMLSHNSALEKLIILKALGNNIHGSCD
jgi:hypothetical protein